MSAPINSLRQWEQELANMPIQTASRQADAQVKTKASPDHLQKWKKLFAKLPDYHDKLTEQEIEKIASVVVSVFRESQENLYLPKSKHVPRALFLNPLDETVYLFSTKMGKSAEGGNKKVYDVLKFNCFRHAPLHVVPFKDLRKRSKEYTFTTKELALEAHFSKNFEILSRPSKTGEMKFHQIQDAYDGDLAQFQHLLDLDACIDIFSQILDFIKRLFGDGFVHKDIKAENILIRKAAHSWEVKLSDYEFCYNPALALFPKSSVVSLKYATRRYTAPELLVSTIPQLTDEFERGKAEDMFALGCLFLTLFSEQKSFPKDTYLWNSHWYQELIAWAEDELSEPIDCKIAVIAIALLDPNPETRMTLPHLITQYNELITNGITLRIA